LSLVNDLQILLAKSAVLGRWLLWGISFISRRIALMGSLDCGGVGQALTKPTGTAEFFGL